MEIVKAVISIGEISIQLEGPQDFVEKYLNDYEAIIKKGLTSTPASHKASEDKETGRPATKRTRTVKSKAGPTCGEKISELISEGFFKGQRTREDVQKQLLEKAVRYDSGLISATLNNLFNSGKIEKTGAGRNAKYYSNV